MNLRMFGIGVTDAILGDKTEGMITEVKTCWWMKVNTKPVRRNMFDGALFPHIVHFTYTVNGEVYQGKRFVNWNKQCPVKDEKITVHYEKEEPAKYAVIL